MDHLKDYDCNVCNSVFVEYTMDHLKDYDCNVYNSVFVEYTLDRLKDYDCDVCYLVFVNYTMDRLKDYDCDAKCPTPKCIIKDDEDVNIEHLMQRLRHHVLVNRLRVNSPAAVSTSLS